MIEDIEKKAKEIINSEEPMVRERDDLRNEIHDRKLKLRKELNSVENRLSEIHRSLSTRSK